MSDPAVEPFPDLSDDAPVLLHGGQALFPALIESFDAAKRWIQLETYIFNFHGMGADVAWALVRAAQRGVTVQVLVDGFGTPTLDAEWQQRFEAAGVHWRVYSPVPAGVSGKLVLDSWRRLHRKMCVVDQRQLFCGGINILDDFYDPEWGAFEAPRFDFAVAVRGPLALQAADALAMLWWRIEAGYSARQRHLGEAWEAFRASGYGLRSPPCFPAPDLEDVLLHPRPPSSRVSAVLLWRDNLRHRNPIERAYRQAIGQARHEVLIANAYFIPGGKLRRALTKAAQRGVRVVLLLQGRYENFLQFHASRPVYGDLLAAGVEIYEYEESFLHAKVAVVDGTWATVGSSNLDPFSLLLAREANVVLYDHAFATELRDSVCEAISSHGRRVEAAAYRRRPLGERARGWLAYGLVRFALLLMRARY